MASRAPCPGLSFLPLKGAHRSPAMSLWHRLVAVWEMAGFLFPDVLARAGKDLGDRGVATVEKKCRAEPEPEVQA